jgi:hypothetical protein
MAKDALDSSAHNSRIKKAFQLGIHVPFWAMVLLAAAVLGKRGDLTPTASEHWAMIVGFAEIGFGLIAAGFGACANYLDDSEEGEDLRRERRALLLGAGALVSAGSALILISLTGADRFVSPGAGVTGALLLNLSATVLGAIRLRGMDELNRGVARDTSHLALTCLTWFGGTWAVLAHVHITPTPDALDWLIMLHGFSFVAGLVAAARRGVFEANPPRATS